MDFVQSDFGYFRNAHFTGSMVNPVGKKILLDQKVLDAATCGIQHLVVTNLERLAGNLVG
jgi:hypothetical protein